MRCANCRGPNQGVLIAAGSCLYPLRIDHTLIWTIPPYNWYGLKCIDLVSLEGSREDAASGEIRTQSYLTLRWVAQDPVHADAAKTN